MTAPQRPTAKRTGRLRELLKSGWPLPLPWGATALHAQFAKSARFDAFGISGFDIGTNLLGLPDAGLLTTSELVENVRRVCGATSIPIIVAPDIGHSHEADTLRITKEIIGTGAAALVLEDRVSRLEYGLSKEKEVVPVGEVVGNIRAASNCRAQLDPDFVLIGRSDVRGCRGGTLEQVVERGRAFLDAGADIFCAESLQTRDEIQIVRDALPNCLLMAISSSLRPLLSQLEIAELRICFTNASLTHVGNSAMNKFLGDYRVHGEAAWIDFIKAEERLSLGDFELS